MLHNTTSQDFPIQTFRVTTQTQDIRDQQLKKGKKKRKRKGIKVEIPKAFKNSLTLKKTTKEKQKVFWRITGVFVWFVHHMPSTKNPNPRNHNPPLLNNWKPLPSVPPLFPFTHTTLTPLSLYISNSGICRLQLRLSTTNPIFSLTFSFLYKI